MEHRNTGIMQIDSLTRHFSADLIPAFLYSNIPSFLS
jgi:hypothetical protein